MKMLKGLEIMGLKQIQNTESVKKGARLSFFGNLLSGFMFNKNANPKKTNLNITGTHFVVKNQPSLKTTSSKEVPVFIRPGTKQVPTIESLKGLLKKNSSEISENDLDPKSEILILRALSAAFVKPSEKSTRQFTAKDSGSAMVQVRLKTVGNKPVLELSVKNAAKLEAIQKFVSKIETVAAKNQIKLPGIQVKVFPQIQKPSKQAKAAGNNRGKITPEKHPSQTQPFGKKQSSEKEILNSKPQKGQPDMASTPAKQKQIISKQRVGVKKVSTAFNGKKLKTAETNPPAFEKIHASGTKNTKSDTPIISRNIASEKLLKTQVIPTQNKETLNVKGTKNAAPLPDKNHTQTVLKNSASVQKTTPFRAKTQIIGENKKSAKQVTNNLNSRKENPKSAKSINSVSTVLIEDKANSSKPNQKSTQVIFKAKAESLKQQPRKSDRQVRRMIKKGSVKITQESVPRSKTSMVKSDHIKTQNTKIVNEARPAQNGKVRFTNASQKGKVFQKNVSGPAPATIGAKAELLQQHKMGSVKESAGIQEKAGTNVKNPPKENIGFTAIINKSSVKLKRENAKKEGSIPGKQFSNTKMETERSHKLHDFSEKSTSKSGIRQTANSEAESVLEFGKQGTDKNTQKTVSETGMMNGTQTSREIQLPAKFAPLVSRINELIQKFKTSSKQSTVKTSFRVAAGSAGEVEIQLDEKTKEKTIKILVESDKVRNELQKSLPQIQQNLLLKGIEFSSIAVDTAPFGSKMNHTGERRREAQNTKSKQAKEVQNEQEKPAVIQKKYGYNTIEVIA